MKKCASSILILIALAGIFSPVFKANAQTEPVGTCTSNGQIYSNWTESACKANSKNATWAGPYVLLVPLPCTDGTPGCEGGKLTTFDSNADGPGANNKLGGYLNIMIKTIIGLATVFAVVMIVIGGIQYMTSELISSKEEGKEKIKDALLGLLIALGAFALLNTINPDLLITEINIPMARVTVELQEDRDAGVPTVAKYTGTIPVGPAPSCPEGVVRTNSGIVACGSISTNIDNMIVAAKAAGLDMSGGGYRTAQQQIQTRINNCNGNTTDANAVCHPPTALPGFSRHEGGVAFDMTCGGTTIQTRDNACFVWLQNNAAKYGLKNYAAEPWHWSIDGN